MNNRNVRFGYFDASIGAALRLCPGLMLNVDCIVTMMDSDADTASMLKRHLGAASVAALGRFGVLQGDVVLQHYPELFTGYDECYIVRPNAWKHLDPETWSQAFTSERVHLSDSVPPSLDRIFQKAQAVGYLADGDGLNVILRDRELFASLERAFR